MIAFDSSSKFIIRPSTANKHSWYLGVFTSKYSSCTQRREKCSQFRGWGCELLQTPLCVHLLTNAPPCTTTNSRAEQVLRAAVTTTSFWYGFVLVSALLWSFWCVASWQDPFPTPEFFCSWRLSSYCILTLKGAAYNKGPLALLHPFTEPPLRWTRDCFDTSYHAIRCKRYQSRVQDKGRQANTITQVQFS